MARAWGVGITPSWAPSSSTTRTCGIRIIWLTRRSRAMADPFYVSTPTTAGRAAARQQSRPEDSTGVRRGAIETPPSTAESDSPLASLGGQAIGEGIPRFGRLLVTAAGSGRGRSGLHLAIAEDHHVRHLLALAEPDLVLHPAVGGVDLDTQPPRPKHACELLGGGDMAVGDRN